LAIRRSSFPELAEKFPVPQVRELSRDNIDNSTFFGAVAMQKSLKVGVSLFFSPAWETGSLGLRPPPGSQPEPT
jgi:hypothetical protein